MKYLVAISATLGLLMSLSTTSAVQAAPPALSCTPGSTNSASISVLAGAVFQSIEVTNAAGSTVGFYATLSNPSGTGNLRYSLGTHVLTFPTSKSTTINTPLNAEFLLLESPDSDVTLNVVCNPGSGTAQAVEEVAGNPSTSLAMVRQQSLDILRESIQKYTRLDVFISYEEDSIFMISSLDRYSERDRLHILDGVYKKALNRLLSDRTVYLTLAANPKTPYQKTACLQCGN